MGRLPGTFCHTTRGMPASLPKKTPMFSAWFAPETALFISMRESMLTCVTSRRKKLGAMVTLRFPLENLDRKHLDLRMKVTVCRETVRGHAYVCMGPVAVPPVEWKNVQVLLRSSARRPVAVSAGRRAERVPTSALVLSRELPGFRAVAVDFSPFGIRLSTQKEVPAGTFARLNVESDVSSMDSFQVEGHVIWSGTLAGVKDFATGLQFVPLAPEQKELLIQYWKAIERRAYGDIQQQQIGEGEFTDAAGALPVTAPTLPPPPPPPPRR